MKLNDKTDLGLLRRLIESAVSDIEARYNVKIKLGNGRYEYDGSEVNFKLSVVKKTSTGEVIDEKLRNLRRYYPEMEGKKTSDGKIVVGYNTRGKRYPWIVVDPVTNKRYKTTNFSVTGKF